MNWLFALIFFVIGTMFGSLLNAALWRAHAGMTVFRGRSMCPSCREGIVWYDNIPLISYALLRGRCRSCKAVISREYPIIEIAVGLLFVLVGWHHGFVFSEVLVRDLILIWILAYIFVYDLRHQLILDRVTLVPAVILFVATLFFPSFGLSLFDMLMGVVIAAGFFLAQYLLSKGKWVGGGDVRLGALMGVALGWAGSLVALLIAYVLGAIVGVYLLATKRKQLESAVPLGTFLAIATAITLLYGDGIISWYVGLIGF